MMLLKSHATINFLRYRRSTRPSNDGQKPQEIHRQSRIVTRFHTRVPRSVLYCALYAVPKKTNPQTHLQGWSFQKFIPPQYQHRNYPSQVKMNQLRGAQGPGSPLWTAHLQGYTKQLIQRQLPGAGVHKPQQWPVSAPPPKRPNNDIQPSLFKV